MEPQEADNAGRQAVLAGRALVDIDLRSVTPQTRRWVVRSLQETMEDRDPDTGRLRDPPRLAVRTRYEAGEALDELGWLPADLDAWVLCSGCAEGGGDLLVAKYPVTNAQYKRFVESNGYIERKWWSKEGWRWRVEAHNVDWRGEGPVTEPEYWHYPRYGRERRCYPAVGVCWYEAEAYGNWLGEELRVAGGGLRVVQDSHLGILKPSSESLSVRLPTDEEWLAVAGGVEGDRYPWDPPGGPATEDSAAILVRANTGEAELGGTSPVGMYPVGASQPFGLMDVAGNVWEWTASWSGADKRRRVLRGGSWTSVRDGARCAGRGGDVPVSSSYSVGFRCVSPISLS